MNNAQLVAITGNTYPVKEQLKALGARWNGDRKAWMISSDKEDEARKIVMSAGAKKPFPSSARRYSAFGSYGARRYSGAWNGCSMGCREGNPNPRCKTCMFDEYD